MATDGFHTPKPHKAPGKNLINTVLNKAAELGTNAISLLSGLLAAGLILFSSYVLYDTFYTQEQAKSSWDLLQYKPEILADEPSPEEGQARLARINSDYRAWLTCYDTNIDYPVMQGENDLYYANHDIYKEVSLTGAIYLAAGNRPHLTDSYNLIYGHHMDNGAMFGGLDRFLSKSYFDSHREAILIGQTAVYDLYAFAVVKTDAYQNRIYSVGNRMDDVLTFLRANLEDADPEGKDWSRDTTVVIFDEAPLEGVAKIVALSTCASATTSGRLVVFYIAVPRDLSAVPTATPEPSVTPGPSPTPEPVREPEPEEEPKSPLDKLKDLFDIFHPKGTGRSVWALVNLICLVVTLYLFLPLLHLGAKFDRARLMGKVNRNKRQLQRMQTLAAADAQDKTRLEQLALEARRKLAAAPDGAVRSDEFDAAVETLFYKVKRFKRRFSLGMVLELIFGALALVAFIPTENMRLPMVLIDRWTPLMILLLLIVWLLDVRLIRYRNKVLADEEEAERKRLEKERAAMEADAK